jgi:hypothetical protein
VYIIVFRIKESAISGRQRTSRDVDSFSATDLLKTVREDDRGGIFEVVLLKILRILLILRAQIHGWAGRGEIHAEKNPKALPFAAYRRYARSFNCLHASDHVHGLLKVCSLEEP